MLVLPRPVTRRTSPIPAAAASSTMYCRTGRSTTGSSSLGTAFVAGRNRVARPAAGITALLARFDPAALDACVERDNITELVLLDMFADYRPRDWRVGSVPPEPPPELPP